MTTREIPITATSQLRRLSSRLEKNYCSADEIAAALTNPQVGWAQDSRYLPPTDEQWREIGKINGRIFR